MKYYRVSASGVVEDDPPRLLTPGATAPSIASDGKRVIVAQRFAIQILVNAIRADGSTTGAVLAGSSFYASPIASCDGHRTLVVWQCGCGVPARVRGAPVLLLVALMILARRSRGGSHA